MERLPLRDQKFQLRAGRVGAPPERVPELEGPGEEHRVQVPARGAQAGGLETPPGGDPERARGELEHGDRPSDALVLEAEVRDHEAAAELGERAVEGVGRLLALHVERLTEGGGRLRTAPQQDPRDPIRGWGQAGVFEVVRAAAARV